MRLNITETEFVVLENTAAADTNAVILKVKSGGLKIPYFTLNFVIKCDQFRICCTWPYMALRNSYSEIDVWGCATLMGHFFMRNP